METEELLQSVKRIKNKSNKDLIAIAKNGIAENYPSCCIIAFCKDLGNGKSPARKRALDDSGFIPCQKHYNERKNKTAMCITQKLSLIAFGLGHLFARKIPAMISFCNEEARKKTISDIKRQKGKIKSLTKKQREFYENLLMEFHRVNVWQSSIKKITNRKNK